MGFDIAAHVPAPDDISQIHGMLWPKEKQLLYYMAAKLYKGFGAITELGCYIGLSTSCLAKGLAANECVKNKDKCIHSYDWFHFFDLPPFNDYLRVAGLSADQQIVNLFIANTRPWASMIDLHAGNLLEQRWTGAPIEILFVDSAKTWQLNEHIVQNFFPSLIAGHSYVVHQDYLYWNNPWIPITMEYFSDYFSVVDCSATTVTFKLINPLPRERVQQGLLVLPDVTKVELMDRAIARAQGAAKPMLMVSKARLLSKLYGRDVGQKLIDHVVLNYGKSRLIPNLVEEMQEYENREIGEALSRHFLPQQPVASDIDWLE